MWIRSFLLAAALVACLPLGASESRRIMLSEADQPAWDAVGRLNVSGQGFCTATLVAPDLVLTAAHCLWNRRTGRLVQPDRLHFLAGFRKGSFLVHGRVASLHPARGYFDGGRPVARDAALVRLREPVPGDIVRPLGLADRTAVGQQIATYSYGRDRSFVLSSEPACHVLGRDGTLLGTSCEATPGVSGAPLVLDTAEGPRVAGVVAAMARPKRRTMRGRAISVAMDAPARASLFDGALGDPPAPTP